MTLVILFSQILFDLVYILLGFGLEAFIRWGPYFFYL